MRRIIEELIEKRKQQQANLKESIAELGHLIEQRTLFNQLFKKNKTEISTKLLECNHHLNELITIQDKEWDAYSNNHATMVFKSLEWKIEKLEAEYSNVRTLLGNFVTLEQSLERLIASIDHQSDEAAKTKPLNQLKRIKEQLSPYQYSDFEQRFRGDESKVKEKLKTYLSIFSSNDHILDIGCGRGEFVELLREQGKKVEGIDGSESMLRIAREKGLPCSQWDALDFLKQQPGNSWGGIFSAQVIEHMEPGYLREMVIESFRVLQPDAPLVLETVNPLSLFALSNIFFLDVSHQRPLHPEFMRYLLESTGFRDVHIHHPEELPAEQLEAVSPETPLAREFNTNVDKLNKLLYAPPVYAVIGIKNKK